MYGSAPRRKCAFVHCSRVPKYDGSMCGSTDHKAITLPHRSRRVPALRQLPAHYVRGPLHKPHYVSAITNECKQQSRPAKTQRTDPTISLDPPSGPTSPLSVTESKPSGSITDAHAPARYFLDICADRNAPLSVAVIKAALAVLVLRDADHLPGGETHDLTDPNVVDYVFRWHCQARLASLRQHFRAATRTQKFWQTWIRGSKTTCWSTRTSLPFPLPSTPLAAMFCG